MAPKVKKKKLVLLDAHAILHRAYHGMPDFRSSKGEPTGALYGLVTMILKAISDFNPDYIIAAYDLPEPTFRKEMFQDYKAGRAEIDKDLITQLDSSKTILGALGIPVYEKAGFEADDILGTIADKNKDHKDIEVIVASGDMDTLALARYGNLKVFTLRKGINDTVIYDAKAVKKRFGFGPELLADYKALRGDPSDNIPGVPGVGEKTATELVVKFGSIENLYKVLRKDRSKVLEKDIRERVVKLLEENEEEAFFSKTLATIRTDAPIKFTLPERTLREAFDPETARSILAHYEFRSLQERVGKMFGDERSHRQEAERPQDGKRSDLEERSGKKVRPW